MTRPNLLKPLLSSGDIRCIGSTTFQEFRGVFDKDRRAQPALPEDRRRRAERGRRPSKS